jgi:hypothetical protein
VILVLRTGDAGDRRRDVVYTRVRDTWRVRFGDVDTDGRKCTVFM